MDLSGCSGLTWIVEDLVVRTFSFLDKEGGQMLGGHATLRTVNIADNRKGQGE